MADLPSSRAGRRLTDPEVVTAPPPSTGQNLPVPVGRAKTAEAKAGSVYDAQLLGQDGQKRGLRGGQPVLDAARSAYLGAEWSGKADRRPAKGILTKTRI